VTMPLGTQVEETIEHIEFTQLRLESTILNPGTPCAVAVKLVAFGRDSGILYNWSRKTRCPFLEFFSFPSFFNFWWYLGWNSVSHWQDDTLPLTTDISLVSILNSGEDTMKPSGQGLMAAGKQVTTSTFCSLQTSEGAGHRDSVPPLCTS
jgi:hypothetical protein